MLTEEEESMTLGELLKKLTKEESKQMHELLKKTIQKKKEEGKKEIGKQKAAEWNIWENPEFGPWMIILKELSFSDLRHLCQLNKAFREFCKTKVYKKLLYEKQEQQLIKVFPRVKQKMKTYYSNEVMLPYKGQRFSLEPIREVPIEIHSNWEVIEVDKKDWKKAKVQRVTMTGEPFDPPTFGTIILQTEKHYGKNEYHWVLMDITIKGQSIEIQGYRRPELSNQVYNDENVPIDSSTDPKIHYSLLEPHQIRTNLIVSVVPKQNEYQFLPYVISNIQDKKITLSYIGRQKTFFIMGQEITIPLELDSNDPFIKNMKIGTFLEGASYPV